MHIHRLLFPLLFMAAPSVWACTGLEIRDAWLREAPPGINVIAAYMTLVNTGDKPIAISGISSPYFTRGEFHSMTMDNGTMRMEELKKIQVPAHGKFVLDPDGNHAMLFNPRGKVTAGGVVSLEISCKTGAMKFTAPIRRYADSTHEHSHY